MTQSSSLPSTKARTATALLLAGFAMLASACNTVEGVGQDLESAGDKAEEVTRN